MAFSKFYRRYFDLVSKYKIEIKSLLLQGLSEPENYGDLTAPKAALLFWFFGDFRCGVSLFIVIHVINIEIGKNRR